MRARLASILLCTTVIVTACGEPSQNVMYDGGKYAGKPDTPAWQSDRFNGSRDTWETQIRKRSALQSEYTRLKGGA